MIVYFYKDTKTERMYEAFIKNGGLHFLTEGRLYVFPETAKLRKLFVKTFNGKNVRIQGESAERFIITFSNKADEAFFLLWSHDGIDI
jgi:hypothetical protein